MINKELTFPIFRKYTGINVWYKILNDRHFIEIKQLGAKFIVHEVEALQYPEIIHIQDMIACREERWEEIPASIFDDVDGKVV